MRNGEIADTIEVLASRAELLRSLRSGRQTKRNLVDGLSVSRSTVDRAVRNLEASGFVNRRDGQVEISLQGRLALDAYESLARDVASLDDSACVLAPLDSSSTMSVALLRGANVVKPDPVTPHRPADALLGYLREATSIRGFSNVVLPSYVDVYRDRIVDGRSSVDLVVTEDVLEELVANHQRTLEETVPTDSLDVWCVTDGLEYSLLIVELPDRTVVCALVYDDSGTFGVVENDAERAVEWADDVFAELRENAELVTT